MPNDTNLVIDQVMPYRDIALDRLRQWLGNRAFEAEDILQNVFVRMIGQKPCRVRHPEKYLLRACANGVKEHFRKSVRQAAKIHRYRVEPRPIANEYDLRDLRDDRRLRSLTGDELRVAWLIAVGFSFVEAAEHLGITSGAARTRVYEARKRLQRRVA